MSTKNNSHQAPITKETPVVTHQRCSTSQLPATMASPVSRMLQG